MKLLVTMLVAAAGMIFASNAESDLLETLRPSVKQALSEFDRIDPDRKHELQQAASFIRERLEKQKPADVTFICTHNSRRSHLCQIWAQTAAH